MRKKVKYVKGTHNFLGENEIQGYEIYVGNKYLGFVTKSESATRSYWFIADTHDGSTGSSIKLTDKPWEYGPYDSWDKTRGGLVYATFPLELGEDPKWIDMKKYSWVA